MSAFSFLSHLLRVSAYIIKSLYLWPLFRYRATDTSGIVEYEVCPVYTARTNDVPVLNPLEVVDAEWVDPEALATSLVATPWAFSPWLVLQAQQLGLFGTPATQERRAS